MTSHSVPYLSPTQQPTPSTAHKMYDLANEASASISIANSSTVLPGGSRAYPTFGNFSLLINFRYLLQQ